MTFTWKVWFGCGPNHPFERQMELEGEGERGGQFIALKSETSLQRIVGKLEM